MDDQPDKDLSKRIKEVFDNYNDASADAGWLKLREKFPEERKRRAIIWLWPAAALLLLFIGLGLLMLNKQKPAGHIAGTKPALQSPSVQHMQKDSLVAQRPVSAGGHTAAQSTPGTQQPSHKETVTAAISIKKRAVVDSIAIAKNQAIRPTVKTVDPNATPGNSVSPNTIAQNTARPVNISQLNNPTNPVNTGQPQNNGTQPAQTNMLPGVTSNQTSPILAHVDTTKKKNIINNNHPKQAIIAAKPVIATKDTSAQKTAVVTRRPANINEMFAADQAKNPDDLNVKTDRRIKLGVYAATYINYAKNGTNQVNGGGGFTAAIPLSKNLKLVTGASVNQNSFNYANGGLNAAAGGSVLASASEPFPPGYFSTNSNYKFATASELNNNTNILADYSHSASLLGIDIPLNLQYQFDTRKYPVYITGGFSSGTFINESYGNVYSNGSTSPTDSYKGLNDFYFARTLNLGFGVGYPLGKSQLIVEPFLKYPITGMGAQQLKFGASGINLKFNFPTKK